MIVVGSLVSSTLASSSEARVGGASGDNRRITEPPSPDEVNASDSL